MLRLLIPCLIWLSSVRAETGMHMQMQMSPDMMAGKMLMDPWMKAKRYLLHSPCPPTYHQHVPAHTPPPIYVKPYVPPVIAKSEVSHPAPMQYVHQQSYAAVAPKPAVTYVKQPAPAPVVVKPSYMPVVQPKVIYPVYQKPMHEYTPIYHKPIYYAPMYQKPMYEPPKVYLKKYEAPVTQIVYQKPQPVAHPPVHYQPQKVVPIQPPQINFVKMAHPVVQPPVYHPHPAPMAKPYCP